jgi:hypothetical protein
MSPKPDDLPHPLLERMVSEVLAAGGVTALFAWLAWRRLGPVVRAARTDALRPALGRTIHRSVDPAAYAKRFGWNAAVGGLWLAVALAPWIIWAGTSLQTR